MFRFVVGEAARGEPEAERGKGSRRRRPFGSGADTGKRSFLLEGGRFAGARERATVGIRPYLGLQVSLEFLHLCPKPLVEAGSGAGDFQIGVPCRLGQLPRTARGAVHVNPRVAVFHYHPYTASARLPDAHHHRAVAPVVRRGLRARPILGGLRGGGALRGGGGLRGGLLRARRRRSSG